MRSLLLALLMLLCACAADPVLLPDSGPCSSACGAGTVCLGGACVAIDAGAVDVGEDRPAVVDVGAPDEGFDAGSPVDSGSVDAGRDVPAVDAGRCPNGLTAFCDGRTVRLTTGERDGGISYFCGSCTNHCGEGEYCASCRCGR